MLLRPLDMADLPSVATWFAEEEVRQMLDGGRDTQASAMSFVEALTERDSTECRLFTSDLNNFPIGIVGFSRISHSFNSAQLWFILGEREFCGRGYTSRAVSKMLTLGFSQLGLHSVTAWTIEHHIASLRVLQRNNFCLIGRQRQAHMIHGRTVDRLLFDLLITEHRAP